MKTELHPEFIAYWTNKGFKVKISDNLKEWVAYDLKESVLVIANYWASKNIILYHFHNLKYNWLPEKDMLSYLRLRAFL